MHPYSMRKRVQLQISNPCSESWAKMNATEKGRICQKCNHQVVDFTRHSDSHLFELFTQPNAPMCGKFTRDQLSRTIYGPPALPSITLDLRALVLGLTVLASIPALGARDQSTAFSLLTLIENNQNVSLEDSIQLLSDEFVVRFTLVDAETGATIDFVKCRLLDSNGVTIGGAYSDVDGKVILRVSEEIASKTRTIHIGSEIDYYETYSADWHEFSTKIDQTIALNPTHSNQILLGIVISTPALDFDIHNPRPSNSWKPRRPGSRD